MPLLSPRRRPSTQETEWPAPQKLSRRSENTETEYPKLLRFFEGLNNGSQREASPMVVVMMMLELCVHWLLPVNTRAVARLTSTQRNSPARRATHLFVYAKPGQRLALIHAPTNHRPLR